MRCRAYKKGDLYQLQGVNYFSIPLRLRIYSQGQRNNISIGRGKVYRIIFRGQVGDAFK